MVPVKIALLTDSCADLSPSIAEEHHIHVVPLRVHCTDREYSDGVDIHAEDIYARLRRGELPKTSLPTGEDISAALDQIREEGYDGVIALMLSGGLSGTYNLVRVLSEERRDLDIQVFDSVSGSIGMGMTLLQLDEDIQGGCSWEELTRQRVPQLIRDTNAFFSVDTLEYLQKGGRIGKITAMAGTMLQIKPLITFSSDGQLQSIAKVRGRKQVIDKLVDLTVKACGNHKRYNIAVACGGSPPEELDLLREKMKAALPHYEHIWEAPRFDATLSVYIGDGILAAAVQTLD